MADIYSSQHFLVDEPAVAFDPTTFPSITFHDSAALIPSATVHVSLTGSAEQRQAFAARLREVADQIESWTEEDANPEPPEQADEITVAKGEWERVAG